MIKGIDPTYMLAGDLGWSFHSAIIGSTLRRFGHNATEDLEGRMIREHQLQYFLPGLRKLGLEREKSDPIRCAKYHYFSNALGGLYLSYAEESLDKAWVIYNTPFYNFDSPMTPSVGLAVLRPGFILKQMRAWHANNGVLLDNVGLAFVVTHLVFRGDPYDAGYFIDTHRKLGPWETLQFSWGEEPPDNVPIEQPQLNPDEWPAERQAKAIRNDVVGYLGSKMYFLSTVFGPQAAGEVVEHALRVLLFQRQDQLRKAFALTDERPEWTAAELLAKFQRLFGADVNIDAGKNGTVTVEQLNSRIHHVPEFEEHGGMPREVEEGMERAFAAFASYLNRDLTLSSSGSFARGDDRWTWVISRA